MTCRPMAVALGIAAMVITTTAARAQQPDDLNVESAQVRERADTADVSVVDKAKRWAEEKRIADRLSPREGVYARFGGMTTGSGLAVGAGYRKYLFDEQVFTEVSAALSTKLYKAVDAKARWAQFWGDRVELWSDFRYRDYPQEDYFGPGADSSRLNRTSYDIESTDIVGRALVKMMPWLTVGADLGYYNPTLGPGKDDGVPSTEQLFTDVQAPALGAAEQPNFLHDTLFAEIDYRDRRGNPTRGGFYRASFGTWEDVSADQFDHHRFDAEAAQFFPVRPTHVVAVRVGLSYVNNEAGQRVPFYFLPYIGGADTLRGFREFRFRDENILFLNAEYRIRVHKFVHVAPFFDAGEVRADWEDIGPGDLKTSYGIGVRAGTEDRVFVRIDVGTGGNEGTRVFFKFGPSF
jgi:outer membrane protein assembly factor BamA